MRWPPTPTNSTADLPHARLADTTPMIARPERDAAMIPSRASKHGRSITPPDSASAPARPAAKRVAVERSSDLSLLDTLALAASACTTRDDTASAGTPDVAHNPAPADGPPPPAASPRMSSCPHALGARLPPWLIDRSHVCSYFPQPHCRFHALLRPQMPRRLSASCCSLYLANPARTWGRDHWSALRSGPCMRSL